MTAGRGKKIGEGGAAGMAPLQKAGVGERGATDADADAALRNGTRLKILSCLFQRSGSIWFSGWGRGA